MSDIDVTRNTLTQDEAKSLQELLDALSEYMEVTQREWTVVARLQLRKKYNDLKAKLNSRSEDNARKKPVKATPRTKKADNVRKAPKRSAKRKPSTVRAGGRKRK